MAIVETTFQPGETVGHFRLERLLGRGGMGAVYMAEDLTLHRTVAIKFMDRAVITAQFKEREREAIEARFQREARSAAVINHPNVAQIYEANFDTDNWYIAMEYIDGTDLGTMQDEGHEFTTDEVIDIVRQACTGLQYAWSRHRIVHRDIKPKNIMLTEEGQVKVVDLGLAKPVSDDYEEDATSLTLPGTSVGTPKYMAPEQAAAQVDLDERVDIYSIGALMYELFCGRPAFTGKNRTVIYGKQLRHTYKPIPEHRKGVPAHLVALVDHMLRADREDRVPTYAAVIDRLVPRTDEGTQQTGGRIGKLAFVTAALMLIAMVGIALSTRGRGSQVQPPSNGKVMTLKNVDFQMLKVNDYWIGAAEVSNRLFAEFAPHHRVKAWGDRNLNAPATPAVAVTHEQALAFCEWLNQHPDLQRPGGYVFRLPTFQEAVAHLQRFGEAHALSGGVWELTLDGQAVGGCSWSPSQKGLAFDVPPPPIGKARYCNVGFRIVLARPASPSEASWIDLNKATVSKLASIDGLTPEQAQAIIDTRGRLGYFRSIAELQEPLSCSLGDIAKMHLQALPPNDLNNAERDDLVSVPGIGPALAERILKYRMANGPFASVSDLTKVSGIGDKALSRYRHRFRIATEDDRMYRGP